MVETLLAVVVILLVVVVIQYLVKPRMIKYRDEAWYGLSINIISILLVMLFAVLILILDLVTAVPIVETGVDFVIKIFGAVFVYEIIKNIHRAVGNGNGKKERTNNG